MSASSHSGDICRLDTMWSPLSVLRPRPRFRRSTRGSALPFRFKLLTAAALAFLTAASLPVSNAAVVAIDPAPHSNTWATIHKYNEGRNCSLKYMPDTTGIWKNTAVDLYSGSNSMMTNLTRVYYGIDGTIGGSSPQTITFPCPNVMPHSAIYFYVISDTNDPGNTQWTVRFAIADQDGTTYQPDHLLQPDGSYGAWGQGSLLSPHNPMRGTATSPPWHDMNSSVAESATSSVTSSISISRKFWGVGPVIVSNSLPNPARRQQSATTTASMSTTITTATTTTSYSSPAQNWGGQWNPATTSSTTPAWGQQQWNPTTTSSTPGWAQQQQWSQSMASSSFPSQYANGNPWNPYATQSSAETSNPTTASIYSSSNSTTQIVPSLWGTLKASYACSSVNPCQDEENPCCGENGICGAGVSCLAGCDPDGSVNVSACLPVGSCHTSSFTFDDNFKTRVLGSLDSWTGEVDQHDFIVSGGSDDGGIYSVSERGELQLFLTEDNSGTRLTSTRSFLYGTVIARMRVPATAGVVSNLIFKSGAKDEIDLSFTTNDSTSAQTNFFWLGDTKLPSNAVNGTIKPRNESYVDYSIEWQPEHITWYVDGIPLRSVRKQDTVDGMNPNLFHFPQTPARFEIGISAVDLSEYSDPNATAWAGGNVDWNRAKDEGNGSFNLSIQTLSIACYDNSAIPFVSSKSFVNGAVGRSDSLSSGSSTKSRPGVHIGGPMGAGDVPTASGAKGPFASGLSAVTAASPSATAWWTPSTTVWWTPTSTSVSSMAWSMIWKQRRGLLDDDAGLTKRQTASLNNITAYVYVGNDTYGQPQVATTNASFIISDAHDTGYNSGMNSDANSDSSLAWWGGSDNGGFTAGATAHDAWDSYVTPIYTPYTTTLGDGTVTTTSKPKPSTLTDKWNNLSTGAHVGVYVGSGVVALLIVVGIGFLWTKAGSGENQGSGKPHGAYQPLEGGELEAGGAILGGGSMGLGSGFFQYDSSAAPPTMTMSTTGSSEKPLPSSTTSLRDALPPISSYGPPPGPPPANPPRFQGGYVPSSALRRSRSTVSTRPPPVSQLTEPSFQVMPGGTGYGA